MEVFKRSRNHSSAAEHQKSEHVIKNVFKKKIQMLAAYAALSIIK